MFHAKAYLRTEETRNLNIPFGESSRFSAGRMSMASVGQDRIIFDKTAFIVIRGFS